MAAAAGAAAITQSGADDRARQPSAGGTPHSSFRSISVTSLSPCVFLGGGSSASFHPLGVS